MYLMGYSINVLTLLAIVQETGVDFGGFQWHGHNGGEDVYTMGYTELIAPLIKAVQELSARADDLSAQVADLQDLRAQVADLQDLKAQAAGGVP